MSAVSSYPLASAGASVTGLGWDGNAVKRFTTREVLSANRTYYVRTDGSDSNDGLSNTSGGAFLTIGRAMTVVSQIDFNGCAVTVQIGNGTYSENIIVPVTVGQAAAGDFVIQGDTTTPSNVVVSNPNEYGSCFMVGFGARCVLQGVKLTQTASNTYGINVVGGYIRFARLEFGACGQFHIQCQIGEVELSVSSYTISGASRAHIYAPGSGYVRIDTATTTVSGTPAFGIAFVYASGGRVFYINSTITGAATGVRYIADSYGTITTYGAGSTFFPGDSAGYVDNGLYA